MNTITKSSPIGSLGLGEGENWVRFHVEAEVIPFELCGFIPAADQAWKADSVRKPTAFVEKWGNSVVKRADPKDVWLAHINEKHLL